MIEKLRVYLKNKGLSTSEIEIVLLIYQGHTNEEIAEIRFISIQTVKYHTSHIYKKLKLKNRIAIFNFCLHYILPELFREKLSTPEKFESLIKQLELPIGLR